MKIPKHIRDKMHKISTFQRKAAQLSAEVDMWLENKGLDVELLRCGDGESLEELDYGNDVTDILCNRIENDDFGRVSDD